MEIILIALVFMWSWTYFKTQNATWLVYIAFFSFLTVFIAGLLNFAGIKVYTLMLVFLCVVAPCSLFAVDMRRGLFKMSLKNFESKHETQLVSHEQLTKSAESIIKACQNMSKNDVGALIVITNKPSEPIVESGTVMHSVLSLELLETLFFPKSPLHDGAVIVMGNMIVSAGCYLPLSTRTDLPKEFGTRHRAAVGISENDPTVTVIVVSEETGIISAMHDGMTLRYLDADTLNKVLSHAYNLLDSTADESTIWGNHHD